MNLRNIQTALDSPEETKKNKEERLQLQTRVVRVAYSGRWISKADCPQDILCALESP